MEYTTQTPVATFLGGVRVALQDTTSVRWSDSELVGYINRAQLDIHRARPDTTATVAPMTLRAGVRQTLPVAAAMLMDVPCNTGGAAITKVDKAVLDSVDKNWRTRDGETTVRHFMHDPRLPRVFEVYPPAASGARVDLEFSAYPTGIAPTSGGLGNLSLAPQWLPALHHLVLFYAWSKDAEYGANAALATDNLARAEQILGVELQTSAVAAPKE